MIKLLNHHFGPITIWGLVYGKGVLSIFVSAFLVNPFFCDTTTFTRIDGCYFGGTLKSEKTRFRAKKLNLRGLLDTSAP